MFVGTVGSGKSTQMKLLACSLKRRGLRVKTTFIKTGHLFAYVMELVLVKILFGMPKDRHPIRLLIEDKPCLFKRLFRLWLVLDTLSVLIRFIVTVSIPLKLKRVVIVEEYFDAAIADYIYLAEVLNLPLKNVSHAVNFMTRLFESHKPMQTLFLDAENTVLENRWNQRSSFSEKPEYIRMQRKLLYSIARFSSSFLYTETSNKTVAETHKIIMNHLSMKKASLC